MQGHETEMPDTHLMAGSETASAANPRREPNANSELMAEARAVLAGKWGMAVGANLLCLALAGVASLCAGPLDILVVGPIMLGLAGFNLALIRHVPVSVDLVFKGFKAYWVAVLARLLVVVYLLAWGFPAIVAAVIGVNIATGWKGSQFAKPSLGMSFVVVMIVIAGGVATLVAMCRYAMTYYVIHDTPGIGPGEAIRRSKLLMRGRKWNLFCLHCRFIGWALLCILSLFIGFIWLTPYKMASQAAFYEDLRKSQGDVSPAIPAEWSKRSVYRGILLITAIMFCIAAAGLYLGVRLFPDSNLLGGFGLLFGALGLLGEGVFLITLVVWPIHEVVTWFAARKGKD